MARIKVWNGTSWDYVGNDVADTVTTTGSQTLTNKTLSTGSTIDENVAVTEVLKKVYPVGSIYAATVSTNPATLFGFGTWAAYGEGRVMVGKAAAGTFSTAGATGGAETHTLTSSEVPDVSVRAGAGWSVGATSGTYSLGSAGSYKLVLAEFGSNSLYADGGGGAHNNLQPYIVTYLWERTA